MRVRLPRDAVKELHKNVSAGQWKELAENEVLELVRELEDVYKESRDESLAASLAAAMARAYGPRSIVKVLVELAKLADDSLSKVCSIVVDIFREFSGEDREVVRKTVKAVQEEVDHYHYTKMKYEIKPLMEALREAVPEERALHAAMVLSEAGIPVETCSAPVIIKGIGGDSFLVSDGEAVWRAKRAGNRLVPQRLLVDRAIKKVEVWELTVEDSGIIDRRRKVRHYRVKFTGPEELVVEGQSPSEIAREVAETPSSRQAIVFLIDEAVARGIAKVRKGLPYPGFYWVNGRIEAVDVDLEVSEEELREAVEVLEELARWFDTKKLAPVLKWAVVAPFSFVYRQRRMLPGGVFPHLLLTGDPETGKTTLSVIAQSIWGISDAGCSATTPARIAEALQRNGTFPSRVDEGEALFREASAEVRDIFKQAASELVARTVRTPSLKERVEWGLSPLIIATNTVSTSEIEPAMLRRCYVVEFTVGDRKTRKEQAEFNAKVLPKLRKLEAIGRYIASRVVSNPELLDSDWRKTGERLLKMVFEAVGEEPPEWIEEEPEVEADSEDVEEALEDRIRREMLRKLTEAAPSDLSVKQQIKSVLDGRLGWIYLTNYRGKKWVNITRGVTEELPVSTLKTLADLTGWEYTQGYVKVNGKVRRPRVVRVELNEFLKWLLQQDEEDPEEPEHDLATVDTVMEEIVKIVSEYGELDKRGIIEELDHYPREIIEDALKKAVDEGRLIEPKPGRYRAIQRDPDNDRTEELLKQIDGSANTEEVWDTLTKELGDEKDALLVTYHLVKSGAITTDDNGVKIKDKETATKIIQTYLKEGRDGLERLD